ncbi:phenazine biosynthesis protein PhzF, partial [Gordonia sp. NPDC003585]
PSQYIATQGAALGRAGRVHVDDDGTDIWVGGDCVRVIDGTVDI